MKGVYYDDILMLSALRMFYKLYKRDQIAEKPSFGDSYWALILLTSTDNKIF